MSLSLEDRVSRAVGRRVAELSAACGWTQATFAERLAVALQYLQKIEHGKQNVTLRTLARVAASLGAPLAERALTPVNMSLLTLEEGLKASPTDHDTEATLARVAAFRGKLRHLLGILDAARMFVMEAPPDYGTVSALALVEAVIGAARSHPLVLHSGLDVQCEIEAGLCLEADATLLQQAFDNIVKNAIEARSERRGDRHRRARRDGRDRARVRDHGQA